MPMTITEALAEIKTIGKRLQKKREAVLNNIGRDSRLRDPMVTADFPGGVVEFVKRERQAIEDLEKRIVTIRTAIQRSNLETRCTVGDNTHTVQEWLNLRREVLESTPSMENPSGGRKQFLTAMNLAIRQVREKVQRDHPGGRVVAAAAASAIVQSGEKPPIEILIHLDEKNLLEEQEGLEKVLGELDGKLSLLNATTVIDV